MTSSLSPSDTKSSRLPELFGRPTQLLGWQGITAIIPESWNMASFGGGQMKGTFRVADDEGLRLEVLWEKPKGTPNIERSIELLLQKIGREAGKKKNEFEPIESPKLIPRSRKEHADKEQLINFGWKGDGDSAIAHGFGSAWHCAQSERVIVVHVAGHAHENPEKTRRLAAEVLSSMESHGKGGWQTWSAYGLQLEIPEEFHLTGARLQTGRIEMDWERVRPHQPMDVFSPREWGKQPERLGFRRISAANVVLENETLEEWSGRVAGHMFKKYRFGNVAAVDVGGLPGYSAKGTLKDFRHRLSGWLLDRVFRRRTPPPELLVWHHEDENKIFVMLSDLWSINRHIRNDVRESLQIRS